MVHRTAKTKIRGNTALSHRPFATKSATDECAQLARLPKSGSVTFFRLTDSVSGERAGYIQRQVLVRPQVTPRVAAKRRQNRGFLLFSLLLGNPRPEEFRKLGRRGRPAQAWQSDRRDKSVISRMPPRGEDPRPREHHGASVHRKAGDGRGRSLGKTIIRSDSIPRTIRKSPGHGCSLRGQHLIRTGGPWNALSVLKGTDPGDAQQKKENPAGSQGREGRL